MHIHYEVDEHQHLHDDELATFSLRKRRSSTHTMYLVEKICTSPRTLVPIWFLFLPLLPSSFRIAPQRSTLPDLRHGLQTSLRLHTLCETIGNLH
jgi:hypothetical protein